MSRVRRDFGHVATTAGVGDLWPGGSKLPAVQNLLERTLSTRKERFCPLLLSIVTEGMQYRQQKGNPLTREEVERVNASVRTLGFTIPELVSPAFLDALPSSGRRSAPREAEKRPRVVPADAVARMASEFLSLSRLEPQERGYAFERFLNELFGVFGLAPRSAFRVRGEQIDGSIEVAGNVYLVEAKWRQDTVVARELFAFDAMIKGHSAMGRGIFIVAGSFSAEGVAAFQSGGGNRTIGIDGQDLYMALDEALPLDQIILLKVRKLVEEGRFLCPVIELRPFLTSV